MVCPPQVTSRLTVGASSAQGTLVGTAAKETWVAIVNIVSVSSFNFSSTFALTLISRSFSKSQLKMFIKGKRKKL